MKKISKKVRTFAPFGVLIGEVSEKHFFLPLIGRITQ